MNKIPELLNVYGENPCKEYKLLVMLIWRVITVNCNLNNQEPQKFSVSRKKNWELLRKQDELRRQETDLIEN